MALERGEFCPIRNAIRKQVVKRNVHLNSTKSVYGIGGAVQLTGQETMTANANSHLRNGTFRILPDKTFSGTLLLDGEKSILHVWSHERFSVDSSNIKTITGELDNNKKVSLIDCITVHESNSFGPVGVSQHYEFFPHYVIVGNEHFSQKETFISRIRLLIDDANSLFYDRDSFGTVQGNDSELKKLLSSRVTNRVLEFGGSPVVAYYTGKQEVFSTDTIIGTVSAFNATSYSTMGGPGGISIDNKIYVEIQFDTPVSVSDIDARIRMLLRFFEQVIGRPQNLIEINIIRDTGRIPDTSSAYLNMYPRYDRSKEDRIPDYRSTLMHAVSDGQEFCNILSAWLERDEDWLAARLRFSAGWRRQSHYDPDRVIAAANMFDLLPTSVYPKPDPLASDVSEAIKECMTRIRELPATNERNAILQSLGSIVRHSLKQKIQFRVNVLTDAVYNLTPEVDKVVNAAVDYRNFCVHGNGSARTKRVLPKFQGFLTDTLEFVFCASDLIECGWDISHWCQEAQVLSHPFSYYLRDYNANLSRFLCAIGDQ